MIDLKYEPDGDTLVKFLASPAKVRLIQGPRGSGKSSLSCFTLLMGALSQPVNPKTGMRHCRTYVIRRTFDELNRTTLNTWRGFYKEEDFGPVKLSKPFVHHIRIPGGPGSPGLDWEVVFLALDNEADLQKLKSAEITNAWINEFSEIERAVLDDLDPCLGRYPSVKDGGCTRPFIIGDTNPGDEMHWFSIMSKQTPMPDSATEEQRRVWTKPDTWEIFIQPPGMFEQLDVDGETSGYVLNPKAENLRWLRSDYYESQVPGKTRAWIRRNICNKPTSREKGTPVWSNFREHIHVAKSQLSPIEGHGLMIGVDFGRTPAAVIGQRVFDRWFVLAEHYAQNMGARRFAQNLRAFIAERFPGYRFQIWGDPAGDHMTEADDNSPFIMFRTEKMPIQKAPSNDPVVRIDAVRQVLDEMVDGRPRFLLSPNCTLLKAAMNDGYKYADRNDSQMQAREPIKNRFSHVADALQYLFLGAGEGRSLLHGDTPQPRVTTAPTPINVFARRQATTLARPRLSRW